MKSFSLVALVLSGIGLAAAANEGPECSGRAIMIRTHNPTLGSMKRINRIIVETAGTHEILVARDADTAAEVEAELSSGKIDAESIANILDMIKNNHHSTKTNNDLPPDSNKELAAVLAADSESRLEKMFQSRYVHFSNSQILEKYPQLATISHSHCEESKSACYQNEAILTAFHNYETKVSPEKAAFCGMWVIDSDVEYTGNWKALLTKYEDRSPDFLTTNLQREDKDVLKGSKIAHSATQMFHSEFVASNRYVYSSNDPITYYSKAFLEQVSKALDEGKHGPSKYSAPTMAAGLSMRLAEIEAEDLCSIDGESESSSFRCWGSDEDPAVAEKTLNDLKARNVEVLVHPVL